MFRAALIILVYVLLVSTATALGVLERESCFYNGKKLDKSISEETDSKTPKVADNFTGTAICYDLRDNRRTDEIEIENGVKNGWERRFDRNTGKLLEEIHNVDGKRHGIMRRYDHRNGRLQQEINYHAGESIGIQKSFYSENEQLKRIYWAAKERTSEARTEVFFNKDGSLSMLKCGPQVISTQDSRWCGRGGERNEVVLYTQNSEQTWPREIRHYKNNLLDGEVVKLHRNGQMMEKVVYKEGERVSSETFTDGKIIHIKKYESGKHSGEEVAYYPGTDKIKIAVEWKNSKKHKQVEFYQNGNPKETQLYKKDSIAVTRYYDNGSKYLEGHFVERGSRWWSYMVRHGKIKIYSLEGNLNEEVSYDNGQIEGLRKLYDAQDGLYREEFYEKGSLLSAKDFNVNGLPIREVLYYPDGSVKKVNDISPGV